MLEPEETRSAPDGLILSMMLALEGLSPMERVAFLMHDVLGAPASVLAEALDRAPAAVRGLTARARQHVHDARPCYPVSREEGARITCAFFDATNRGDFSALKSLLADTVVLVTAGGGSPRAWLRPVVGLRPVIRRLKEQSCGPASLVDWVWINGLPGYVSRQPGGATQTTTLDFEDGRVVSIFITLGPDPQT